MEKQKIKVLKETNKNFITTQKVIVREHGKPNMQSLAKKLIELQY